MLARPDDRELDALLATAFGSALASIRTDVEREALIQRFGRLNRQLSLHLVRAQLLEALRNSSGMSFPEIVSFASSQYQRLRPSRRWMNKGALKASKPAAPPETFLKPGDVARELGVSARTVTNWCKKGLLECVELESGHRLIPARALASYRKSKLHWGALDALAALAREGEPEPDEDEIFEELARRAAP